MSCCFIRNAFLFLCFAALTAAQGINFDPRNSQLTPPPSNTPPEKRCVLSGRAVNALTGEPVKKVNIRLSARANGGPGVVGGFAAAPGAANGQGYSTATEADGTFRIESVEPGNYSLSGDKSGFLRTNYGAKKPNQMGTTLVLSPGQQLTDVSVSLTPQAVLTGKVTDEDGDPISGGMIQVVKQTWMRGKQRYLPQGGGQVNDLGEYRVANLSPGKYYLSVQTFPMGRMGQGETAPPSGKPDIRPVRTYYPGTVTLASATPIEVKAGQDLAGLDIRMQSAQTYHIRGKVVGSLPEDSVEHASLNVSPRDGEFFAFFNNRSNVKPDGTFDIAGIPPGSYTLNYFVMNEGVRVAGHQNVDVGAGDADGVALTLTKPGSLRGIVRVEGSPQANASSFNPANVHVGLTPSDFGLRMGPTPNAKIAKDGSFTLENVNPGKYFVQAHAPGGTYLKSVRYGSTEVLGKELDLSGGASGEIELVYRYGPGEVDGTVQLAQNSAGAPANASSAQILLAPDTLPADGSGVLYGNLNSNGSFTMAGVPPGHYRAYAFEEANYEELQNPEVLKQLEQKGTDVEVKENDKKQIQLPLISSDELQQLLARAGITAEQ